MIYWFTGASMQAVTTGAYRAVEFIKANIKLDGAAKASVEDSKKVVEICTQYAQKGMFNIFLTVFFSTLAFAFLEPYFFIGYLISIALFGLYQAIFMANAGGAWDNAKKIVEVELKEKGTPLHAALRRRRHRGRSVQGHLVGGHEPDHQVHHALRAAGGGAGDHADRRARVGAEPYARRDLLRDLAGLRLPLVLRHAHPVGSGTRRDREGAGPPRKLRSREGAAGRPRPSTRIVRGFTMTLSGGGAWRAGYGADTNRRAVSGRPRGRSPRGCETSGPRAERAEPPPRGRPGVARLRAMAARG